MLVSLNEIYFPMKNVVRYYLIPTVLIGFKCPQQMRTVTQVQKLSQPQQQHNLNTAVGLGTKMTLHTTTQTQHQLLGAPNEHLLTPT